MTDYIKRLSKINKNKAPQILFKFTSDSQASMSSVKAVRQEWFGLNPDWFFMKQVIGQKIFHNMFIYMLFYRFWENRKNWDRPVIGWVISFAGLVQWYYLGFLECPWEFVFLNNKVIYVGNSISNERCRQANYFSIYSISTFCIRLLKLT